MLREEDFCECSSRRVLEGEGTDLGAPSSLLVVENAGDRPEAEESLRICYPDAGEDPAGEQLAGNVLWSNKHAEQSAGCAREGVFYDRATNTLTLEDFQDDNAMLVACSMGEDLTIRVVGTNRLRGIESRFTGANLVSITIDGAGSLAVNENRRCPHAISIRAGGTPSRLVISPNVTLTLRSNCGAVLVKDTTLKSVQEAVVFSGNIPFGQPLIHRHSSGPYVDVQYQYIDVRALTDDTSQEGGSGYVGHEPVSMYVVRSNMDGVLYGAECRYDTNAQPGSAEQQMWQVYKLEGACAEDVARARRLGGNVVSVPDANGVAAPRGYTRVYSLDLKPETYDYWLSSFGFVQLPK